MESLSLAQRVTRALWRAAPARTYSDLVGWGAARPLPRWLRRAVIGGFARRVGADLAEAELAPEEYGSLQAFFTRRLRAGARPLDPDPRAVVHPADGRLVAQGAIAPDTRVLVKGIAFSIPELLGGADLADPFVGGQFAITYLSPRDYHRVHSPFGGEVTSWVHVPGTLFPVNPGSVAREPGLFALNERLVTLMHGPEIGRFAVVMVAAVGVGHITVSYDPEVATHGRACDLDGTAEVAVRVKPFPAGARPALAKGSELGIFHLGSTAIILFERDRVAFDPVEGEPSVRVGARIGRLIV